MGSEAVKAAEQLECELHELRAVVGFYAKREHWMRVSENAVAATLFIAGLGDNPLDGFAPAEKVLAKWLAD